jgi:hypothetical protein
MEELLAVAAIRAEEKKHEQGCRWQQHVMGSSNEETQGRII